jgi:hypothetical protein
MQQPIDPITPRSLSRTHVLWSFAGLLLVFAVVACAGAGAGSTPTPVPTARPTPTPVTATVETPEDAATLVIASDPRFAGATELNPDLIGASRWWVATPLAGGGYTIEMTVGWGDCMAGCIERHVWTYEVKPDGTLTLVDETGDEVPVDLPA